MPFDSFPFVVFIAIVFPLYLLLSRRWQNPMLLVASYVFYGWWDWRFLSLILASTVLDFYCGGKMAGTQDVRRRRQLLFLSIAGNLTILGFFKYFDFFIGNAQALLGSLGLEVSPWTLKVLLPPGISFYTFQTMSYTIDIYNRRMEPTRRLTDFALFVAFFPQLVAGPIERASHLLPQVAAPRRITRAMLYEGGWLVYWGFYKKIFVADNLGLIVDKVYGNPEAYSGPWLILATYAFAFQIYCDFSGYTDIARGIAKTMGFDILQNFNLPYFARNPQDFWRRWHISLSRWLRDYLYIPLGGNRGTRGRVFFNLMATMTLGGLWHGATWAFVLWGIYHGMLLVAYRLVQGSNPAEPASRFAGAWQVLLMFHWTCLGWILFRAGTLDGLLGVLAMFGSWTITPELGIEAARFLAFTALVIVMQIVQFAKGDLLVVQRFPAAVRVLLYVVMYFSLMLFGAFDGRLFIYFTF